MSRTFGSYNSNAPRWLQRMSAQTPACFSHPQWVLYLESVQDEAQEDNALRMRLNRGQIPDYCKECTDRHQRKMVRDGKCHPPAGAITPCSQSKGTAP